MSLSPAKPLRRSNRLKRKRTTEILPLQYQPLINRQIRVLHLAPGQKGDPLVGELRIGDLDDDDIEYDALSYMWGETTPVAEIKLGNEMLPIARNLSEALQCLRYLDMTLVIWIDAVCINQMDVNERGHQVGLMRQLFSCAQTVRTFINVTIDATCEAFRALQNIRKEESIKSYIGDTLIGTFWEPVAPLFRSKYWSRAWVQQEILFAREWIIRCKNTSLSPANVLLFLPKFDRFLNEQTLRFPARYGLIDWDVGALHHNARELLRKKRANDWRRPLCDLLVQISTLEATVPCDKLYACMHLASDYEQGSIQIAYKKSHVEALFDAAEYHVRHNKNVSLLVWAYARAKLAHANHPSWLPSYWLDRCEDLPMRERPLRKSLWSQQQLDVKLDLSSLRLQVRGINIDGLRRSLTTDFDLYNITASRFWNSQFGRYFQCHGASRITETLFDLLSEQLGRRQKYFESIDRVLATLKTMLDKTPEVLLFKDEQFNPLALDRFREEDRKTFMNIFVCLEHYDVVQLLSGKLAMFRKDCYEPGARFWIVLGCDHCIILQPQSDGTYRHLCPAIIPAWEEYEPFKNFTEASKAGDRIEDFVVEDIEIA